MESTKGRTATVTAQAISKRRSRRASAGIVSVVVAASPPCTAQRSAGTAGAGERSAAGAAGFGMAPALCAAAQPSSRRLPDMARLHADEIAHYQQHGYVVPRFALPGAQVARMQQALDELIRRNPGVRPEKLVSAHVQRPGGQDNGEGVQGVSDFLDLARDPQIVELVSGVVGEDIILWGCHVFCKPAGEGYETPWHQDGHYWPIRPLATCTVWVALEPSTVENGCLRVIPRSHAVRQLHEHLHEDRNDLTLNQRLAPQTFDENSAVDLQLQPGQMSLHDVYMIHGAAANTSKQRRTGVALRYMPTTSVFERQMRPVEGKSGVAVNFANRPLWLVRGIDRSGRNDLNTGHKR